MKQTFKYVLATILGATFMLSCEKSPETAEVITEPEGQTITQTFTCKLSGADDPTSKVSLDTDGKTEWETGDQLFVHANHGSSSYSKIVRLGIDAGSSISGDKKTATFTVTLSDLNDSYKSQVYVAYPASAVKDNYGSKPYLYYTNRFSNTNNQLLTGFNNKNVDEGRTIWFYNLCACISFVVNGDLDDDGICDFDEYVFKGNNGETVGYSTYQVRFDANPNRKYAYIRGDDWCDDTSGALTSISVTSWTGADNTTVNKIYIPYEDGGVKVFPTGFTIEFKKGGSVVRTVSTGDYIDLSADSSNDYQAQYMPLGNITSALKTYTPIANKTTLSDDLVFATATDLSDSDGPANSYWIPAAGQYKFPLVKGNTSAFVGDVKEVAILWETYNDNSATVDVNSVIAAADYYINGSDRYIVFKTPGTLKPGNALIAAKNSLGKILWSWHIWIPKTSITTNAYNDLFGAGVQAMDRNLGALVAAAGSDSDSDTYESYGLYYQWGRKDPFPGPSATNSTTKATVSVALESKSTTPLTLAQSIAHPTQFAYNGATAVDPAWDGQNWCSQNIAALWNDGGSKGLYDPCPPGYRVPIYNSSIGYWMSDGWSFDTTHNWFKKEGAVFSYSGYLDDCSGNISYAGASNPSKLRIKIWGANESSVKDGSCIYVNNSSFSASSNHKAGGASIRCVTE